MSRRDNDVVKLTRVKAEVVLDALEKIVSEEVSIILLRKTQYLLL